MTAKVEIWSRTLGRVRFEYFLDAKVWRCRESTGDDVEGWRITKNWSACTPPEPELLNRCVRKKAPLDHGGF